MSQNDILFSRGVSNATIVASGTKIAVGVVSNPLTASLADVDFQIIGNRGVMIPTVGSVPIVSTAGQIPGLIRYNRDNQKLEFDTGNSWNTVVISEELSDNQFRFVGDSNYIVNNRLTIIPGILSTTVPVYSPSVGLDIQGSHPHLLMRNISAATGNSQVIMIGGTGNTTVGAINGYNLRVDTGTDKFNSGLTINAIVNSNISVSRNVVKITPGQVSIEPIMLSLSTEINNEVLKVVGGTHLTKEALYINKHEYYSTALNDSNKIATFNYSETSVLDLRATGRVIINGEEGGQNYGILSVKGFNTGIGGFNPGYVASFRQGASPIIDGGILVSTAVTDKNLAVFASASSNKLVITGAGGLSVAGNTSLMSNLTVLSNVGITGTTTTGNLSVLSNLGITGTTTTGNLSVLSNLGITGTTTTGNLSVLSNLGITGTTTTGNLSVLSNVIINGELSVIGNAYVGNDFRVLNVLRSGTLNTGDILCTDINATRVLVSDLAVSGSISLGSLTALSYTNLNVTGTLSAANAVVSSATVSSATVIGVLSTTQIYANGDIMLGTNNIERMRISNTGNVGIGITSPAYTFDVRSNTASSYTTFIQQNSPTGNGLYVDCRDYSLSTYALLTRANNTNSFPFSVSTNGQILSSSPDTIVNLILDQPNHGNAFRERVYFRAGPSNIVVGSINTTWNGSFGSTSYNTSSDYRIKEDIDYDVDFLSMFMKLRPAQYSLKGSKDKKEIGFIAHELQEEVEWAVIGQKDAVDDKGVPRYQMVDYSKVVGLLAGALKQSVNEQVKMKETISQLQTEKAAMQETINQLQTKLDAILSHLNLSV
jgi:hypothetical protein